MSDSWLNKVNWTHDGLVPVVVQEAAVAVVAEKVVMMLGVDRAIRRAV